MRRIIASLCLLAASAFADAGIAGEASIPHAPYAEVDWTQSIEPFRIAGNIYYVGAKDLTSYLIVTPKGDILLDVGVNENAAMVQANIRKLGFDPRQIKIILNSHAHLDHAGGIAAMKRFTHARFIASARDKPVLESGGRADFRFGPSPQFPAVKVDQVIGDGGKVSLGGVTMTAHLTPGHTKGCTTWTMPVTVDGQTRQALFLCSLSILPGYKLTGDPKYAEMGADYAHSYAVLHTLPCEVFLASHGMFYGMLAKRQAMLDHPGAPNPFVDPAGCKAFFDKNEAAFRKKLAAG
jgi:metallo-beta-lactamase class B